MVTPIKAVVRMWRCCRCGHKWIPRKKGAPKRCANQGCRSPYWDSKRGKK